MKILKIDLLFKLPDDFNGTKAEAIKMLNDNMKDFLDNKKRKTIDLSMVGKLNFSNLVSSDLVGEIIILENDGKGFNIIK